MLAILGRMADGQFSDAVTWTLARPNERPPFRRHSHRGSIRRFRDQDFCPGDGYTQGGRSCKPSSNRCCLWERGLLLLTTTFATWIFYTLTSQIGQNVAWLQGPIGSLTVKFGGPAALFFVLLWLGHAYVPYETLITLAGEVTNESETPVKDVWVVSAAYAGKVDEHGKFTVTVPRASNSQYDLVVFNAFDFKFVDGILVNDSSDVKIKDFPDPNKTTIIAKELTDQDRKPINGVRVYVESIARPQGGEYRSEGDMRVEIDRRKYSVKLADESNKVIYDEQFTLNPGLTFELPQPLTIIGSHQ
jgi:hypothetical protein